MKHQETCKDVMVLVVLMLMVVDVFDDSARTSGNGYGAGGGRD